MRAVRLVAAALLTAGCAGSAAGSSSDLPPTGVERVGLTEWTVATEHEPLVAGQDLLEVTNAGATSHDVAVSGADGMWKTQLLAPGEHAQLRIRTRPGETLRLWCTVPGHDEAGMRTTLTAAAGVGVVSSESR